MHPITSTTTSSSTQPSPFALHEAIANKDQTSVDRLFNQYLANNTIEQVINTPNPFGTTPLHLAIDTQNTQLAQRLISCKADVTKLSTECSNNPRYCNYLPIELALYSPSVTDFIPLILIAIDQIPDPRSRGEQYYALLCSSLKNYISKDKEIRSAKRTATREYGIMKVEEHLKLSDEHSTFNSFDHAIWKIKEYLKLKNEYLQLTRFAIQKLIEISKDHDINIIREQVYNLDNTYHNTPFHLVAQFVKDESNCALDLFTHLSAIVDNDADYFCVPDYHYKNTPLQYAIKNDHLDIAQYIIANNGNCDKVSDLYHNKEPIYSPISLILDKDFLSNHHIEILKSLIEKADLLKKEVDRYDQRTSAAQLLLEKYALGTDSDFNPSIVKAVLSKLKDKPSFFGYKLHEFLKITTQKLSGYHWQHESARILREIIDLLNYMISRLNTDGGEYCLETWDSPKSPHYAHDSDDYDSTEFEHDEDS